MSDNLAWVQVDANGLSKDLAAKLNKLKLAQAAAKVARDDFESSFITAAKAKGVIEKHESLAFGYRFGRVAVAKTEDKPKAKATAKPMLKL
jgi:hypothetical protein